MMTGGDPPFALVPMVRRKSGAIVGHAWERRSDNDLTEIIEHRITEDDEDVYYRYNGDTSNSGQTYSTLEDALAGKVRE